MYKNMVVRKEALIQDQNLELIGVLKALKFIRHNKTTSKNTERKNPA